MFKSYYVEKGKGVEGLHIRGMESIAPEKNEILIKVKAAAFNFRELMIIDSGKYSLPVRILSSHCVMVLEKWQLLARM